MPTGEVRRPRGLLRTAREGITLVMLLAVYAAWIALVFLHAVLPLWIVLPLLSLLAVQFMSLQHEALHGHPTRLAWLNELLVSLPLGGCFPYRRYRRLHLQHHNDENLTDPFDDPETWYFEPEDFERQPAWIKLVWRVNATLAGRLVLGPLLSCVGLIRRDAEAIFMQERRDFAVDWGLHLLGLAVLIALLSAAQFPLWLYALGVAYPAMGILMIRSFAEHRASENKDQRTAIIPDEGIFGLLFLNNNLHAVHHAHPSVPWYRLPQLFKDRREEFEARNGGYGYRSYWELIRKHWRRPLHSIKHPLWSRHNRQKQRTLVEQD